MKNRLHPFLLLALLAIPLRAGEVFSENFASGYERGKLVGQNGWSDFEKNPSSPIVYDTEGRFHSDFSWAVISSKPTSSDDWALKTIPSPNLEGVENVVVEIVASRILHPKGAGSHVMFGYGAKLMDKGICLSHEGIYFRDGWGRMEYAIDANGEKWNNYDSQDVVFVRSVWNLKDNTVSLAIKNHSRGETEFTPLFFDKEQKQSTIDFGVQSPLDKWNQVFIRTNGFKGSQLFQAKISTE